MAEDSASWYARKLAQMRGAVPPSRSSGRTPYSSISSRYPAISSSVQQAPPAARPGPPETLTELLDLQQHGQGLRPGKGATLNPDPCPNCGGNLFYADLGLKRRGPPPAPHCFTCGYNELFEQGLESNWQGGA